MCRAFSFGALWFVVFFSMFSRVALGSHSLDQVILGVSFGMSLALMMYVFKDFLVIQFLKISETIFSRKTVLIILASGFIVCVLDFFLCSYLITRATKQIPQEWISNYIAQCGEIQEPAFYNKHRSNVYLYNFLFYTPLFAACIDSLFLNGTIIDHNQTSEEGPIKGMTRWLICGVQFYMLKTTWTFLLPNSEKNYWIGHVWIIIMLLLLFTLQKFLFKEFKLCKEYMTADEVLARYEESTKHKV